MRVVQAVSRGMLVLCLPVMLLAADVEAGLQAFRNKDFKKAFTEFLPLAQRGDRVSQFYLGVLYNHGTGVEQNWTKAVQYYRLSAEQGYAKAQCNLGTMLGQGAGAPKDPVEAHMWFYLAAQSDDAEAVENGRYNLKENARNLTPRQLEQALTRARNWKPKRSGTAKAK
jgi:TPR repeat protein